MKLNENNGNNTQLETSDSSNQMGMCVFLFAFCGLSFHIWVLDWGTQLARKWDFTRSRSHIPLAILKQKTMS